jgi:hypothetical protein
MLYLALSMAGFTAREHGSIQLLRLRQELCIYATASRSKVYLCSLALVLSSVYTAPGVFVYPV